MIKIIKKLFKKPLDLGNGYRIISMTSKPFVKGGQSLLIDLIIRKDFKGRTKVFNISLDAPKGYEFLDQFGLIDDYYQENWKSDLFVNAYNLCGIEYNEEKSKNVTIKFGNLHRSAKGFEIINIKETKIKTRELVKGGYVNFKLVNEQIKKRDEYIKENY